MQCTLMVLAVFTAISMILSIVAVSFAASIQGEKYETEHLTVLEPKSIDEDVTRLNPLLKKFGFGSCTSHYVDKQPIWTNVRQGMLHAVFLPSSKSK